VCFPVLDKKLKKRVIDEGLKPYLKDNRQAWDMRADGHYVRKNPRGTLPRSAQMMLLGELARSRPLRWAVRAGIYPRPVDKHNAQLRTTPATSI
jgi:hypothetical protein